MSPCGDEMRTKIASFKHKGRSLAKFICSNQKALQYTELTSISFLILLTLLTERESGKVLIYHQTDTTHHDSQNTHTRSEGNISPTQ